MKSHLEANLKSLARLDARLADRLREVPLDSNVFPEEASSGVPSLRARATDGTEIRLHSAYDPEQEARDFARKRVSESADAFALSGLGFAYHARAIAERIRKEDWLFLIEAKEELFRAALEHVDLQDLFSRPRTFVFVGADWVAFLEWLHRALNIIDAQELCLITYPPCARLAPEFYARVADELQSAVNRRIVELSTLIERGRLAESNAIQNLAFLPDSFGFTDVEGMFAGVPAIVVAAGPSLESCLEELGRAVGRCVVITVGKSLSLLVSRGIEPEFTANLDMNPDVLPAFRGCEIPPRTVLVYDEDSHPEIPRMFPGPKVTYATPAPVIRWADGILGPFGKLDKGLSVAHTAFQFARATGADPILLVGVDLAIPGTQTHARGVTMTWGGEVPDTHPHYLEIPSVKGGKVKTIKVFKSFVTIFEVEVSRTKAKVIQTSPDGALIRGAESLPFGEALDRYAVREHPIDEIMREKFSSGPRRDRKKFEKALDRLGKDMEDLRERAASGGRALGRAMRLDRKNRIEAEEFKKLGARMKKTSTEIETHPAFSHLQRIAAPAHLELRRISRKIYSEKDVHERTGIELEWLQRMFDSTGEAAGFFLERLQEMRAEVRPSREGE